MFIRKFSSRQSFAYIQFMIFRFFFGSPFTYSKFCLSEPDFPNIGLSVPVLNLQNSIRKVSKSLADILTRSWSIPIKI